MKEYLSATDFIDSDDPFIVNFAVNIIKDLQHNKEKAVALYNAVRDFVWYDPYRIDLHKENIKASIVLKKGSGYCVEKAILLTTVGRAASIPSRLGFAIVRNHLASEKFLKILRSDLFVFHGYNEFFLDNKWVKCTPAFNKDLCEKYGVDALDFDGSHDSLFQQFDRSGKLYMEYLYDYGSFTDLPYDLFVSELRSNYGHLFTKQSDSIHQGWYLNHPF